jgi:hypothetical protein
MRNPFKINPLRKFKLKFTDSELAVFTLENYKLDLEKNTKVRQVRLNVISDKLRKYLGESSKVYYSFSQLDINQDESKRSERIRDAAELVQEAIYMIEADGVYEDLQMQLLRRNIKESKSKITILVISGVAGFVAGNAKDIGKFLLSVLRELHR